MAKRPVFIPKINKPFFEEVQIDFEWFPGFSKQQAQKSINSLHQEAAKRNINPILEISSKSLKEIGVALSAFNLMLTTNNHRMSVECAFQGSKIFEKGGPFTDLYFVSSKEAKTDQRLRNSGELVGFRFFGEDFPINPQTAFYDWLYLMALSQNPTLANELLTYKGFSDIAFNPEKSINCQARSAALFVALTQNSCIEKALKDKNSFLELMGGNVMFNSNKQISLFSKKDG